MVLSLLLLWTSGCEALWGPFNTPHLNPDLGGSGGTDMAGRPPVDILFLIDNSPAMFSKQVQLAQHIAPFLRSLDEVHADYHIGFATSDVGSFPSAASPFQPDVNHDYHCQSFAGDDGALQHTACTVSGRLSSEAMTQCNILCPDASFVPSGNYIAKSGGSSNLPQHLVTVTDGGAPYDDGPLRAFQCLAMVGDTGCDIEGQLEGAKRALDGHNAQNAGFLRPGSILVVIFLTDEDDCSTAFAQRDKNDPMSMNCTPGPGLDFHCYNPDYRCIAQDLICNEGLYSIGTKTGCKEQPSSYLERIATYGSFFTNLRAGNRFVLGGIWPPVLGGPNSQFNVIQFAPGTAGLNRSVATSASCFNADPSLSGRPQLRLSSFGYFFRNLFEINICSPTDYESGLHSLTGRIQELEGE